MMKEQRRSSFLCLYRIMNDFDTPHPQPLIQIIQFNRIDGSLLPASTITRFALYVYFFMIIDQFMISGLTITVIIREAMSGMETTPPLGYFRSYIGKAVGA